MDEGARGLTRGLGVSAAQSTQKEKKKCCLSVREEREAAGRKRRSAADRHPAGPCRPSAPGPTPAGDSEVNVKQLQDAAVLVPANLLFTGGHLIYQT
ncbi:hypothetical protein L3Q82_014530 [Scortum barcoo]|uniref:Uncharacterized protein n=1 Tax=Scortum barcoo TaxID=214431 RepID=A0ACB8VX92_9TELE|nr:hypothetical protein L3Q82_014530 [Scortum barcoo]